LEISKDWILIFRSWIVFIREIKLISVFATRRDFNCCL
jgi:hypothetical protein